MVGSSNSRMVGNSEGQAQDQTMQALGGKIKLWRAQGARSSLTNGRGQAQMTGAATSTAINKCPCHADSPAANLPNYSAGCAMVGLAKI
jgi:hypothetical protein